jgi:MFS family permease
MAVAAAWPAHPRRGLLLLCVASAGWAFSFGLGTPLASLWLRDAGCNARTIGLCTSVYYLGVALAALLVPWLMKRSSRTCVALGMAGDALTTALFPWVEGLAAWLLLRLVGGVATAMSLIPTETWVNHDAAPERRARDFGLYAVSVALGVGLGSLAGLPLYPLAPRLAFALGGLVTLAAAGLAAWGLPAVGPPVAAADNHIPLALRENLLSYGTAWAQGFLEGGMIAFLSLYLLVRGYTETAVSGLLGGLFLGVILFQVPVASLADRLGRLPVLLACHAVLLAGLLSLPFCTRTEVLSVWLFLLGACCGALYPLGLALLGERLPAAALAQANAWYLASNCAGSLSGPMLLGLAIDFLGPDSQLFVCAAALVVAVAAWAIGGRRPRELPAHFDRAVGRSGADGEAARIAG